MENKGIKPFDFHNFGDKIKNNHYIVFEKRTIFIFYYTVIGEDS